MAESISTIDKFTTNRFGIVLKVLRFQNPAMINVFPIIDKIANTTAIIDSNTTMTSGRWGKVKPSSLSSILEISPVYRASDLKSTTHLFEFFMLIKNSVVVFF